MGGALGSTWFAEIHFFLPECVAKGSRFKSGGLEVDTVFATFVVLSSFSRRDRAPCNTGDIVGFCVWL